MRIFGFDIGTTSIGYAVIQHDGDRSIGQILRLGVRIFPEARDPEGTPLNQTRRQKRLARRQLRRRRLRRRILNELLAEAGLLPPFGKGKRVSGEYEKSAWEEVMGLPPLPLRKKGSDEKLELHELGRAIYHLAQRRHYRERDIDDERDTKDAEAKRIDNSRLSILAQLRDNRETLGQLLARRDPHERKRGVHANRRAVVKEFVRLWRTQARHHEALRERDLKRRLAEAIFAQRPPFWRMSTLGTCPLMPGQDLCPKGSWLSQQRRMLEKLNNLALAGGNARPLDADERAAILERLQSQASMSWAGVRAALKPIFKARGEPGRERTVRFNLEDGGDKDLLGNPLEAKLSAIFGESWQAHPHRQAVRDAVHQRLWAADYRKINKQRVVILPEAERRARRLDAARTFIRDFGVTPDQANALPELKLPTGWEPYSTAALRKLLPQLESGVRFGALRNGPEWADWQVQTFPRMERPTDEGLDRLPSLTDKDEQRRLAAVRNPTVVRVQNELRKVVNNLIGLYGKPDLIRVELAREVGKSKLERDADKNRNKANERQRKTAAEKLSKRNVEPSRRNIDKWLLWQEAGERCPYSGAQIGFDQLFGTSEFEIEHIWPRRLSLDDSFANKTLCRKDYNAVKGKRTPYDAFGHTPEWELMTDRIWKWVKEKGFPKHKAVRFCRTEPLDDDFRSRQLNDTGYAARQIMAQLKRLWPDVGPNPSVTVQAVTGRVTDQLRRLWELNNILTDHGEKTRADHRHHAIDALVVACTDPGITNRLSRYWQQKDARSAEHPHLPPPWLGIRADVQRIKDSGEISVSHRVRKKVSGPLHDEMPFGDTGKEELKNGKAFRVYVKRMPVENLPLVTLRIDSTAEMSRAAKFVVRDPAIRRALADHVERAGGDSKKAYPPYPSLEPHGPEIRKVRVLSLRQKTLMVPVSFHVNGDGIGEPTGYADPANNHHVAIYRRPDGSADFEIVSLYEASRRLAKREPVVRRKRDDGSAFMMSLSPGEAVEFLDGERKGIWIVQGAWASGQVVLTRDSDARPSSKKEAGRLGMDGPREEFRPKVSTLISATVRKVAVDPIGRIRPAND